MEYSKLPIFRNGNWIFQWLTIKLAYLVFMPINSNHIGLSSLYDVQIPITFANVRSLYGGRLDVPNGDWLITCWQQSHNNFLFTLELSWEPELELVTSNDICIDSEVAFGSLVSFNKSLELCNTVKVPSYPVCICQYQGRSMRKKLPKHCEDNFKNVQH